MKNLPIAMAALISTIALPVNAQSTWTGSGKIIQVYTQSNGTILFQHQNTSNVQSCQGHFILNCSNDFTNFQIAIAILLDNQNYLFSSMHKIIHSRMK